MKHKIDPMVDCVFKAILGSEAHKNLLIHFLNAVLQRKSPICEVVIQNPYNEKEFANDKLSIVDVKAQDKEGNRFQVEIQVDNLPELTNRILYTWAKLYTSRLKEGDGYEELKETTSIWILKRSLFKNVEECHLNFQLLEAKHRFPLNEHCNIHLLQVDRWEESEKIEGIDRWIYLFREGKEMEEAMGVLKAFSEQEKMYGLYQNRMDAERVEITWKVAVSKAVEAKEKAIEAKEKEREAKEKALKEVAKLQAKLKLAGININEDE